MSKTHLLIVQILGLILVLCGYFMSDEPDSLSVMHFNSNPSSPSVISKAFKSTVNTTFFNTSVSSDNNSRHKSKVPRHVSFEIILPHKSGYNFSNVMPVKYTCALPENYSYLFYEEINPPPPKSC